MVTDAAEYRWSSAADRAAGQRSTFLETDQWLAPDDQDTYAAFLNQPDSAEEKIRGLTTTGRPLGHDPFVLRMEATQPTTGRRLRIAQPGRPQAGKD